MQTRITRKIIIDEQKLTILIRLGCPDDRILSVIKTGKFEKTGDKIIDEILECFVDKKEFKNWGGNHNPKGINNCKKRKKLGQVDNQVESQDIRQDVDIDKDIDKDNIFSRKFKKPSFEEVKQYCQERNNGVDPNKWFNYYTANGWKVGRNPMKDWRATVRTWERQSKDIKQFKQEPTVLVERGKFFIDDSEKYSAGYSDIVKFIPEKERESLWHWFISRFEGKEIKLSFIRSVLTKSMESRC